MEFSQLYKNSSNSFLLSYLIDNVSDAIIITDNDLIIKRWNRAAEKIYGWTAEEIVGKKINEISNMEFSNISIEDFKKELFNKRKWQGEFKQKGKGGNEIHFFSSCSSIENNHGNIIGVIAINCDITKKKTLVQNSEDFNERYKLILDNAYDLITILDKDLKHEFINEKVYFNQLGYKKEDIIGKTPLEPLHPDDIKDAAKALRNGLKKGSGTFELRLKKKNGPYVWLECKGTTFIDKNGEKKALIISRDIDERKKMELKSRDSEEKYRLITENANDLIIVENEKFEYEYINEPAFKNLLGYSEQDLLKKTNLEIIHPDDLKKSLIAYSKILRKGKGFNEFRIKHKNGEFKWFEAIYKKFSNSRKENKFLTILRNIDDRKKSEFTLFEQTKQLELLNTIIEKGNNADNLTNLLNDILHTILDGLNFDGGAIYIIDDNSKIANLICHKGIPLNIVDLIKSFNIDVSPFNKIFVEKQPIFIENYSRDLPKPFKEWNYSSLASIPLFGKDKIIGALNLTSKRNYSFTKEKQELFKIISRDLGTIIVKMQTEKNLQESEEQFRIISEHSFMGIIIFQKNKILYINEVAADTLEYSIEEMLNWSRKEIIQKCFHPDDLPYLQELIKVWKKEVFDLNPNISFRIITKLGKIKWIEQYPKIFQYKGNEALMISFLDITDKKEAEKLITEENKKLLELDKLKDDLILRMSHELKTPLTTIYLASQMLLTSNKYKLDDEVLKYIQIINRGNIRLKSIMENLLDISKIDTNKFELNLQENNIIEIVKESISDIEYLATSRKIEFKYDLHDTVFLTVDKIRIEQVIINIISNAIKNTPIGGKIYIKTYINSEFIDIQIKDTGIGLTNKEKERLFEKFGKIERPGMGLEFDIEGTGLGLYISKHIVESHGGKILVESEGINKGSTFTIRLFKK